MNKILTCILTILLTITTNAQDSNIFYHIIERGQTVYSIAIMYGVGVEDIYRLNPETREVIKAGDKLRIPQIDAATTVTAAQEDRDYVYHTIQPKETLYSLSIRYEIPAEKIIQANPGLSVATFQIGKNIRIPSVEVEDLPKTEIQTVVKDIEYKVEKKETMYRLTRKFNITAEELIEKNPQLAKGVKAGMIIKIPVRTEESVTEKIQVPKEKDVNALLTTSSKAKKVDKVKVALLLPFMTDEYVHSSNTMRFIEYYEGLLLAVDSLKNAGISFELVVRDTGKGTQKLKQVLQEEKLKNVHLIIGALESDQISLIAEFAEKNKIKHIIPFTSKNDDVLNNYYVYQVNTPHSYLYAKASQAAYGMFYDYNIVFVDTYDTDDKAEFVKQFKLELTQKNIPFKDLVFRAESFTNDIHSLLVTDKRNVVIPISSSVDALNKIRTPLRMVVEANPQYMLNLFGYPTWQTYVRDCLDDFFVLDTYIYTNFYADNMANNVSRFNSKYKSWFSKELINSFPKYGILGFDTGMYFFEAINKYGLDFEKNLNKIKYKGIQTQFDFERVNNWGGFINTNLFIVHYNKKDYSIVRHEIKK
ncbi:LysM repeat protein [Parabacteroides sp. PF5-5]|uniref:LysM peptidoglycan-binding domain-containing protein n=1 Tax=unclassified Parabacteroides TaxID=2649774 RepID=UPI002476C23F|nr:MULTISPECIES: LysM peptidoglycan-binding domain-containing protein [unclassified Parabacteroides]MDH6304468.1 LysM repeat protein [Parabacteroides sp. PH5-39]MDH6315379.1 LysM repeat protein [Parabacteroides sp. PF5-13]MDH6319127.1 LysM repeat protein [Parabacteroides sp. PH5-13]MDH6322857.1 LysM repeat protein [Parabacteroides sp. PH5-8]MDH6326571.1 LysM repeat protein [Parabacteroides sp. PH5-41]